MKITINKYVELINVSLLVTVKKKAKKFFKKALVKIFSKKKV